MTTNDKQNRNKIVSGNVTVLFPKTDKIVSGHLFNGGGAIIKYEEHFHLKYVNMTLQRAMAHRGKCRWQKQNEN